MCRALSHLNFLPHLNLSFHGLSVEVSHIFIFFTHVCVQALVLTPSMWGCASISGNALCQYKQMSSTNFFLTHQILRTDPHM